MLAAGMYDTGPSMVGLRVVALLALLALLGTGLTRRRAQDARRRSWGTARGLVSDERFTGYGAGELSTYVKVVEFRTEDGRQVVGTPLNGSNLGTPVIGRVVPVWYDRRDPQRFEADVHWTDRAGSFALLGAGLAAVLVGVSLLP